MECYACQNEATRQCRRCARVYCELHGGDLCAECLSPASALPSFNLYRGSLLALLIGTAVALWLIVRPPGSGDSREVLITQATPTAIVQGEDRTPTEEPSLRTPEATAEPGTPTTEPTPTAGLRTYVVQDGDTLIGIAERFAPPGVEPFDYASQIASASGISIDQPLGVGSTLILP